MIYFPDARAHQKMIHFKSILRNSWINPLLVASFFGVITSLASGLFENPPEASIIGAKYFGHPIVWRVVLVSMTKSVDYRIPSLAANTIFWIAAFFVAILIIEMLIQQKLRQRLNYRKLVLPLVLVIPSESSWTLSTSLAMLFGVLLREEQSNTCK